jgi:hypothetical protein
MSVAPLRLAVLSSLVAEEEEAEEEEAEEAASGAYKTSAKTDPETALSSAAELKRKVPAMEPATVCTCVS